MRHEKDPARQRKTFAIPREEVMAEINITPLTDVLLVLLIIFLIAASTGIFGFNLRLPKGRPQKLALNRFNGVLVTIPSWVEQKHAVFVGKRLINLDILPNFLYREHLKHRTSKIVLHVDESVPYAAVIRVMDSAKTARLDDISFAVPSAGPR